MPIRDSLPAVLRGEAAVDLSPESRAFLESLAVEARGQGQRDLILVRDECAARLKQPGASRAVEYLLAAACAQNGEIERAHQTLLTLGDKLAAASQWEPLAAIAEHALALENTQAAARLLVRAHEGLARDPARIEALQRALEIMPGDLELGLLLAVRLGEAGRGDARRELLTRLMPNFAAEGRHAGLEEAALEFVEHEYPDGLVALARTLPTVAAKGALREALQLLEIAFPLLQSSGRAGETLPALRELLATAHAKSPATAEPLRAPLVHALRQGPARELPDADAVLRLSGIEDNVKPVLPALDRFDAIASLPPGRAVYHDTFGAGRVNSNDGETVIIDFAQSRGHKMPFAAARRTLSAIGEEDLRLLRATDPAALERMRADEPAEVVRRALLALGGAGDAQKLKVFLVGTQIVANSEWTAFWRRARAACEKDARIDASRAFEQHYRLATRGADEPALDAPLPALEPRKPIRSNLATIRKFLSQHPQAEKALARRFGKYVERATLATDGDPVDRARAGIYFARWFPERLAEWTESLSSLWEQGLAVSNLTTEDDQIALLEASHAAGVEADAILSALDSRFAAVRAAAERLKNQLDANGQAELRRTMLRHAVRYPSAALRLIDEEMAADRPPADAWRLLVAALTLIAEKPKPSVAEKVMRWVEPGAAFDRMLAASPCPEEVRLQIRVLLRQWRSSDRMLFPVLESLERLGLVDEATTLREARARSTEKLFERVGQQTEEADVPIMTRATWERLHHELERMDRELRTTIPATIQRARELGDLKENAEYHSAKLKQANVARMVASLKDKLSRARFVDDLAHKDGIVGLGTEVVLESEQDMVTYWVLGDDEHHHGEHVVSHQAPVGRTLMGRTIGDDLVLGEGDQRRTYRVVSVERKLPPREPSAT